nr:PREDICTED: laccase-3-like isoform X2 [Bemisia tabaci]
MMPKVGLLIISECLILLCFILLQTNGQKTKKYPIQLDDINNGTFDDLSKASPDSCTRICDDSQPPKVCYYRFVVEFYVTLSHACQKCPGIDLDCFLPKCCQADGFERGILTVNRRMPGPSIQVCKGDTIVVDVKNSMPGKSLTIHWHGINQYGTPHMDGVPMITQCPILPGTIFRYKFLADTEGTYFWHSHDGTSKMDGLLGSLVVRQPKKKDPNWELYDDDLPSHVILFQDWMHLDSDQHFPGLRQHDIAQSPDNYLVNGRGNYPKLFAATNTPFAQFDVAQGRRYRFRLIAGTCLSCAFQVTIENHPMLLIATETSAIEPVQINSVNMWAGDRYDVVINADKRPNAYWIFVRGLGLCSQVTQVAVLKYKSWPLLLPLTNRPPFFGLDSGVVLGPDNSACNSTAEGICVSMLRAKKPMNEQLLAINPTMRLLLTFGFHLLTLDEAFYRNKYPRYFTPPTGTLTTAWINNISNIEPMAPLLTQLDDVPLKMFCSQKCLSPPVNATPCYCINLIKVPLGATVELILIDPSPLNLNLNHPMHFHGFNFHILAQGKFNPNQDLNPQIKSLQRKLLDGAFLKPNPPLKDVISVPSFGYVVLRFLADNPGVWFFHCHFLYHHLSGMSATLQIGEPEDFPPAPKKFPRCGDFLPPISDSNNY